MQHQLFSWSNIAVATPTVGLLEARGHGAQEVVRRHEHLVCLSSRGVDVSDLQRRKVAEHLVRRGEVTDTVLILHDLTHT